MKKTLNIFLLALLVFAFAACEKPQPEETKKPDQEQTGNNGENNGGNNGENNDDNNGRPVDKPQQFEFPYIEEYPLEAGNLIAQGSDVGVTIEVTKVEDMNFVFELRPGAMVQSFKLDVYPISQLYNNLLNDKGYGYLTSSESWAMNQRIRDYLFDESGSGGYAFSIKDFASPEDFLQIEFDWMNTSYAAASAVAIPDCGYIIAVVASIEDEISSNTQEELTLCYVHTTSKPLVGDPQCEIEVATGYTAFAVQHHLNADAAAVYFFGWLSSEIDAYIDAFGDTLFRDFIRTRVTSPSYPDDPNNPQSLFYSVTYGEGADPTVMSATCAVAVDANLTPQECYSRADFKLKEVPEDVPEAVTGFHILQDRVAARYVEYDIEFSKDAKTVYYKFFKLDEVDAILAMSDKEKRAKAREIATDGLGWNNPNFAWDSENEVAVGSGAKERQDWLGLTPGETYRIGFVARNGAMQLSDLQFSEPFTMDELNLTSPDACNAGNINFYLDEPTRSSFRQVIEYDPAKVSAIHLQYMTRDFNPGWWTDASWEQWIDWIYFPGKYMDETREYAPMMNTWAADPSGYDTFVWTGMTPGVEYTVYMCVEDFDGNVSKMYFASIVTEELQIGPDPTINMTLSPYKGTSYDWTVSYEIDHDVEYFLYCYTDSAADLSAHMPGLNQGHFNNIKDSGISYEEWYNGIYEWVAGGFTGEGGGMRTASDTTQDWAGNQVVIAACIAVGQDANGDPVYNLFHLICKDGKAQTLEEIFGITE